jgi:hypothetical protein
MPIKVTGDVPGINFLLSSFYLHTGNTEKAFRHLSLAVDPDKDLFKEFEDIFPTELLTRKIKKLLKGSSLNE